MTFKPLKPYHPWYDDERDYNTNAPTYYDYLANSVNLEKVQTDAINDLLVRDVDFLDSNEIHVDKLTDWHDDDPNHQSKTTFKAHVITSPKTLTYSLDNVDYQASNALKVLDSGLYSPDFSQVISQQTGKLNEASTTAKRAETKADNAQKGVNSINGELSSIKTNISSLQTTKQNNIIAGNGIKVDGDKITGHYATRITDTSFDLDNFKEGAIRGENLVHAPQQGFWFYYEAYSEGDFIYQRAVKQPVNDSTFVVYIRFKTSKGWSVWDEQLTAKKELTEAIKNVNKSYNLQNPDIYQYHAFSNVVGTVSGDWGIEFFNDTSSKIYNIKVKVGVIENVGDNSIIAQQNVADLKARGVPQDFIEKAKNGYVFRAGYYLADSLTRIAFELKTENDKMSLYVKYHDGAGTITSTQVVQGHECAPIAVTYNNAISIEETGEVKPVVDATEE